MERIKSEFPELCKKMLTNRFRMDEYEKAFAPKGTEHIKTVIEVEPWNSGDK